MRVLIVDGHSMIFAWPELRALHAKRGVLARDALVKRLTDYHDFSGIHVVAVFDGKGGRASEASEPGGIQVFYSRAGQTADEIVERLVAKYAGEHDITVATDDHLEEQTALSFGATCISSEGLRLQLEDSRDDLQRELKKRGRKN
jgi:uncharacterized protein